MKLTLDFLKKHNVCQEGIDWYKQNSYPDTVELAIEMLIKEDKFQWTSWLFSRVLSKDNKIKYAIFAAKQILHIFEKKYPKDKRPRKAVEAAENYLKNKTKRNKQICKVAADASYDAAHDATTTFYAAADTVAIAVAAANAATNAAYAAAANYVAANYATTAAYAAAAAGYAAYANISDVKKQVIKYGLKLMNK